MIRLTGFVYPSFINTHMSYEVNARADVKTSACIIEREEQKSLVQLVPLFLCFIPFQTILFLDLAHKVLSFAGYFIKIIVGQFAPFFLNSSFKLFPVTFHNIFIHSIFLWVQKEIDGLLSVARTDCCTGRDSVPSWTKLAYNQKIDNRSHCDE